MTGSVPEEEHCTYGELYRRARSLGALLGDLGAAGERVLLLYPSGLNYVAAFFGCLFAGAVAVPAYPPRNNRSLDRIRVIAEDSEARFALTSRPLPGLPEPAGVLQSHLPQIGRIDMLHKRGRYQNELTRFRYFVRSGYLPEPEHSGLQAGS